MNRTALFLFWRFLAVLGMALASVGSGPVRAGSLQTPQTLVLYNAELGKVPSAPLLGFTDFPPGAAPPAFVDGATVLDTTASNDIYAGWVANGSTTPGFPILDRTAGFQVDFTVQVESEAHANDHRAGFSMILLSEDARGIELAFWQNEVWVQNDDATGGLFRHGEGAALDTTSGLVAYQVTITGDHYALSTGAEPILSGPVRDYSAFEGFPDPYQTPNFLFLGDDTTSAQARVRLSYLAITGAAPVAPTIAVTSTVSATALPTESPAPLPTGTPAPSPTPAAKPVNLCPSAGILIGWVGILLYKKKERAAS